MAITTLEKLGIVYIDQKLQKQLIKDLENEEYAADFYDNFEVICV